MAKIRELKELKPIYFLGDLHTLENNYTGLPRLFRDVADFLELHPEYNSTSIVNIIIGVSEDGDRSHDHIIIFSHIDEDHTGARVQQSTGSIS
jgi:hypothetical protein